MTTIEVPDPHITFLQSKDPFSTWCRETCTGEWNISKFRSKTVQGSFEDERDAMLFTLKFGKAQ